MEPQDTSYDPLGEGPVEGSHCCSVPTPQPPPTPTPLPQRQVTEDTPIYLSLTIGELNRLLAAWLASNALLLKNIQSQVDYHVEQWKKGPP